MGGKTSGTDSKSNDLPHNPEKAEGPRGLEDPMERTGMETSAGPLGSNQETPELNHLPVAEEPTESREHNACATLYGSNGMPTLPKARPR
jgi:hypothetical protein